jgi:DNA-directed RNA polymerase subunit RPC12/RpoP
MIAVNDKCPGKSMRNLTAKIYRCRHCGGEVEMFSDEPRVRCKKCRNFIYKEQLPCCIEYYSIEVSNGSNVGAG